MNHKNRLHAARQLLASTALLLLAACGGGSSGENPAAPAAADTGPAPPAPVVATEPAPAAASQPAPVVAADTAPDPTISKSNAEPLADAVLDAVGGQALLSGTTQLLKSHPQGAVPGLLNVTRALVQTSSALQPKSVGSETTPCAFGGYMTLSSGQSSDGSPFMDLAASTCSMSLNGAVVVIDGNLHIDVHGGMLSVPPHKLDLSFTANQFRIQSGPDSVTLHGDALVEWISPSDTSERLVITGTSFSVTTDRIADGRRTIALKDYRQAIAREDTEMHSSLDALVEVADPQVSLNPLSYWISTLTPVVSDTRTGRLSAGSVRVRDERSTLLIDVQPTGAIQLQLDEDGDGVPEHMARLDQPS